MFKINIPITSFKKSAKNPDKLIVEGIASDPTIDRDKERFTEGAIKKMAESVNKGGVKIRVEHQNKFYTNVGDWTEAHVTDDNKLYVKGEIDTRLSLGNDIAVKLGDGDPLFLSVGGRVLDAVYEYVKELGHDIKAYKDVVLDEISVLMTPSNFNTSLSIAKSVDWERVKDPSHVLKSDQDHILSEQAITILKQYKSMIPTPIDSEEFSKSPLTTAERNNLKDSDFAYVQSNGKDAKIRKLPIQDAAHVRNALAVLGGARGGVKGIPASDMDAVKAKVDAAAKKFKVGQYAEKGAMPMVPSMMPDAKMPTDANGKKKKVIAGKETKGSYDKAACATDKMFEYKSKNPKMKKWFEEVGAQVAELFKNMEPVEKDILQTVTMPAPYSMPYSMQQDMDDDEDEDEKEEDESEDSGMEPMDYVALAKLVNIMSNVDLPDDTEVQNLWQDQNFSTTVQNLGEDGYIIMSDRSLMYPHHNSDYTVNEDWLLIQLKKLLTQGCQFLSPEDYTIAIDHMYKHLKELSLVKTAKQDEKTGEDKAVEKGDKLSLTKEDIEYLKSCYEFRTSNGPTPMLKGEVAPYAEVIKGASYFASLLDNPQFISLLNKHDMAEKIEVKKEEAKVEPTAEEQKEPTEVSTEDKTTKGDEAKVEAAPEAKVEEKVEAPAPAATAEEAKPTEEAKPEAVADAPVTEPVVEQKVEEAKPEGTEKSVQKVEVSVTPELQKAFKDVEEKLETTQKALKERDEKIASFEKSVESLAAVVEKVTDRVQKAEMLEKTVTQLEDSVKKCSAIIEKMAGMSPGRKSYATAAEEFKTMEKSFSGSDDNNKTLEGMIQKELDAGAPNFQTAYRIVKGKLAGEK